MYKKKIVLNRTKTAFYKLAVDENLPRYKYIIILYRMKNYENEKKKTKNKKTKN